MAKDYERTYQDYSGKMLSAIMYLNLLHFGGYSVSNWPVILYSSSDLDSETHTGL